jgi:hypothetical protein
MLGHQMGWPEDVDSARPSGGQPTCVLLEYRYSPTADAEHSEELVPERLRLSALAALPVPPLGDEPGGSIPDLVPRQGHWHTAIAT